MNLFDVTKLGSIGIDCLAATFVRKSESGLFLYKKLYGLVRRWMDGDHTCTISKMPYFSKTGLNIYTWCV